MPVEWLPRWLVSAMVCALLLFGGLSPVVAQTDEPLVETTYGPVIGTDDGVIESFLGIPYASPPVGELRYLAPRPPAPWESPFAASEFGPACVQTPDELELSEGDPMSEDCLTLNVWTPDSTGGARPVFVWVHGGAFSWGTARHELYDGRTLAERGDVVVVTIQYRLGSFGWLDLSGVGGEASSANNGMLDMVAALEWVQDNVASFGGDPSNVTIAGESAGGTSIGSLLTSAVADGLFDRAILQSGSPGLVMTADVSSEIAAEFMTLADASTVGELRSLTTEELLAAQQSFEEGSAFADIGFHPVIDGVVVEYAATAAIRDGVATTVPVLIGTTRDESRYWLLYYDYLDRLPLSYSEPWLDDISNGRSSEINDAYLVDRHDLTDGQIGLATAGASAFTMPAIRLAEALASHGSPVWMYQFTLPSNELDGRLGSPHAMELPFMFYNLDGEPALLDPTDNPTGYQRLAETMQDSWISFTRTGDPSTDALGVWPAYDEDDRHTMVFDLNSQLVADPYPAERIAWGDIPFDGLTPSLVRTNPLSHPDTEITLPVIIAVIGPIWTALIVVAFLALLAGIGAGIFWLFRRRRRNTTAQ